MMTVVTVTPAICGGSLAGGKAATSEVTTLSPMSFSFVLSLIPHVFTGGVFLLYAGSSLSLRLFLGIDRPIYSWYDISQFFVRSVKGALEARSPL